MLDFDHLTIQNFKAFVGKPQPFKLARGAGLHFIAGINEDEPRLGSNGSAKSTIFDALTWCLYERTVGGLRNPDVAPWNPKGKTIVHTQVHTDKFHTVTRELSPNRLLLDDKEVGQEEIEQLLGINFEVFRYTVLLGQNEDLFFDLSPRDKLQLFSETLNLERWEDRAKFAAVTLSDYQNQLTAAAGEIAGLGTALGKIDELIKEAKVGVDEWDAERKAKAKNVEKELAALNTEMETVQRNYDKADTAYDRAATEVKSLIGEDGMLRRLLLAAKSNLTSAELDLTFRKEGLVNLKQQLTALGKTSKCPTCGQVVKRGDLSKHRAEIEAKLALAKEGVTTGGPKTKKLATVVESLEGKLSTNTSYLTSFRSKAESARNTLDAIRPRLSDLKAKIAALQASKTEEANPYREQLRTLRQQRKDTEAQLTELDELVSKLQRIAERTRSWTKGFKDVRLYIIEELIQELEIATNTLLPESGLIDWSVSYDIEKETKSGSIQRGLNVMIQSPRSKKAVRWESWSGGEGQRLRVVGALALSEVLLNRAGVQCNLEILDEPTRGLSIEGVNDLCEYLADRAEQLGKVCLFVDQMAVESSRFASTTTVIKTETGSIIEGG